MTKAAACLGERRRRHAQPTPDERMRRARATLVKRRRWYAPMILGERRRRARVTREAASCSIRGGLMDRERRPTSEGRAHFHAVTWPVSGQYPPPSCLPNMSNMCPLETFHMGYRHTEMVRFPTMKWTAK